MKASKAKSVKTQCMMAWVKFRKNELHDNATSFDSKIPYKILKSISKDVIDNIPSKDLHNTSFNRDLSVNANLIFNNEDIYALQQSVIYPHEESPNGPNSIFQSPNDAWMALEELINNENNFDLKDYFVNIDPLLNNEDMALQQNFVYFGEELESETSSIILPPKDVWLNLEDFMDIDNEFDLKDCFVNKHTIINNEDLASQQTTVYFQEELENVAASIILPPNDGWLNPEDLMDSDYNFALKDNIVNLWDCRDE